MSKETSGKEEELENGAEELGTSLPPSETTAAEPELGGDGAESHDDLSADDDQNAPSSLSEMKNMELNNGEQEEKQQHATANQHAEDGSDVHGNMVESQDEFSADVGLIPQPLPSRIEIMEQNNGEKEEKQQHGTADQHKEVDGNGRGNVAKPPVDLSVHEDLKSQSSPSEIKTMEQNNGKKEEKRQHATSDHIEEEDGVENLPAEDIPIPTELERSVRYSLASSPGAFAQPGMNASGSSSNRSSSSDTESVDEAYETENDVNEDSSAQPPNNGNNRAVVTRSAPVLLTATLVEENQLEDAAPMMSAPVKRVSSVVVHAEPWEDPTVLQHTDVSASSSEQEDDKERVTHCRRIIWWQILLVMAALVALGVGVALAVVNAKSEGEDIEEDSSDFSPNKPPKKPKRPRGSLTSTFHVLSWGSFVQDCGNTSAPAMNTSLHLECSGMNTTAKVWTLDGNEEGPSVLCTQLSPNSFTCQQEQERTSQSTDAAAKVGILVQCFCEKDDDWDSSDADEETVPSLTASVGSVSAATCMAPYKEDAEDENRRFLRRVLSEHVVKGGGIGRWLTVGRICWFPSYGALRIRDWFPCRSGSLWQPIENSTDPSSPHSYCLDTETCADDLDWTASVEETCSLNAEDPLEMKTGGTLIAEECHVHHDPGDDLPELWRQDQTHDMLLDWLKKSQNPETELLRLMRASWESYLARRSDDAINRET